MKKLLSLLMVMAILIVTLPMGAFTLTVGAETADYYNYIIEDDGATIISVDQNLSGDITIPSYLGGYPVKTIGGAAFSYCTDLVSIVIPDTVTVIGDDAFYFCQSLTEVVIPNSVTSIGYTAFAFCTDLSQITIPESVTYIADDAFEKCDIAIYGYEGSYAQTYADENGLLFIAIYDCKGNHTALVDENDDIVYMLYDSYHAKCCWLCGEEFDYEAHYGEYVYDEDGHFVTCLVCGLEILATEAHSFNSDGSCDICGYGCSHNTQVFIVTADATCTTAALGMFVCDDCGVVMVADIVDPTSSPNPYAHVYDAETGVCAECGAQCTHGFDVDSENGALEFVVTVPGDCTTPNKGILKCTICGLTDTSEIEDPMGAIGHTYGDAVEENRVESTCTIPGSYDLVHYCIVCDAEIERVSMERDIDLDAHTYDHDKDEYCNECGSYRDTSISGDVNDDGRINNKDLVLLQRYLNGWDFEINCNAADVNDDGLLNNKDFGLLMQYRCGWDVRIGL